MVPIINQNQQQNFILNIPNRRKEEETLQLNSNVEKHKNKPTNKQKSK